MSVAVIHIKRKIRPTLQPLRDLLRCVRAQHMIVHRSDQQHRAGELLQLVGDVEPLRALREDDEALQLPSRHGLRRFDQKLLRGIEHRLRVERLAERQIEPLGVAGLCQPDPFAYRLILLLCHAGGRGAEHQLFDKLRMPERDLHGDHTALRYAHQRDVVKVQRLHGLRGVPRHIMHGVCARRRK